MDVDCVSQWQQGQQQGGNTRDQFSAGGQHPTQFQAQSSVVHMCNHQCSVVAEFGNVYRCISSGLLHVCDANCSSRVYRDRYSSICLISKKVCPPLDDAAAQQPMRKRGCGSQDGGAVKRMSSGFGTSVSMA